MSNNRDSNIELLRIVCMILLVAHHLAVHSGLLNSSIGTNRLFTYAFVPIGKISFDTFLAISSWYMVEASFNPNKFICIWLQVLFYNVVFTVVSIVIHYESLSIGLIRALIGSFFPILGNSHGFASTYLLFLLIIPFLKIIVNRFKKKTICFVTVLLFIIQVVSAPLGIIIEYTQPYRSELLLFVLFYFISYCLKNCHPKKCVLGIHKKRIICIIVIVISYSSWLIPYIPKDESSLFNIVGGYALFFFAKSVNISPSKIINEIASTTFGILLFHDHNIFRKTLWHFFKTDKWASYSLSLFVMHYVNAVVIVFVLGMFLEMFRKKILEKLIENNHVIRWLSEKMRLLYQEET